MKAFITGINGFAGSHLALLLADEGWEVAGVSEKPEYRGLLNPEIPVYLADIRDTDSLKHHLSEYAPTHIFHLAGFASPALSKTNPLKCLEINALGTASLLQAASDSSPDARILVATTSHIHNPGKDGKISEDSPYAVDNPYSISKLCASHFCRYYCDRGLRVIEARPANHYGPWQVKGFVVADFAAQVAGIMMEKSKPPVKVGNLDVKRDFLYVEDVARAYAVLALEGKTDEAYCIGSGKPVAVRRIIEILIELSGTNTEVVIEKDRIRDGEIPAISVSCEKINSDTGWEPQIKLGDGLSHTLDYWLDMLKD